MSISLDSLASSYTSQISSSTSGTDKLENTLNNTSSSSTDDELMDVCKQFEAYFIEQVLKEMKNTIPETESTSASMSQLKDYYEDQLLTEYSSDIANQGDGIGLAQTLYEQMKRNYNL